jgi:exosortase
VLVLLHGFSSLLLTPYPIWPAALALFTITVLGAVLSGAWLLAGADGLRWTAGPLVILLAVLPAPSVVDSTLIAPMREGMATFAAEVCNLLGRPAVASGTSVRLASSWVGIDEACGGIRSLQACLMIALFFGEWFRFSLTRRVALVLAGCSAAILGNGGRVIFLSLRANINPAAVESAHEIAGWTAMGMSVLATGWLAWVWGGRHLPASRRVPRPNVPRATPVLRWATAVAAGFVVSAFAVHSWFAHGAKKQRLQAQWTAELPENAPSFRKEGLADAAREMLRPDVYTAGTWIGRDGQRRAAYFIEWQRGQVARSTPFLHNPTVCLPLAGCELVRPLGVVEARWSGGTIPFHAYVFRQMSAEMTVAFAIWDNARARPLEAPLPGWRNWIEAQWRDIREAREHQPAQIFTFAVLDSAAAGALAAELEALLRARRLPE